MNLTLLLVFFGIPMIIGLVIQSRLRKTFAGNSKIPISTGKSGADVAREILDRNGLRAVPVQASKAGPLSDHYDPRKRGIYLSQPVYEGRSVASTAVAAHEVGHALQHANAYVPMTLRSAVWPLASFGQQAWFFLLIGGVILNIAGLITLALAVFGFAVLFQLVTLPVEFNASRRAAVQLSELGLVTSDAEAAGVRQTLSAAAMTYVAGALAAVSQLIYFLMVFGGRD
jgi:Zn-dependent membrane protease YugP